MATTQKLGIVSPVPKGTWSNTMQYDRLNIVRYNGNSYIATEGHKNSAPSPTNQNWMLLTQDVQLPSVTSSDNGKFLRVVNGTWQKTTVPSAETTSDVF